MNSFQPNEVGGLYALQCEALLRFENIVWHGSFSRHGGISPVPYDSLNTHASSGDTEEHVITNRQLICRAIGIELKNVLALDVCHGSDVAVVPETGPVDARSLVEVDAIVTRRRGCALLLSTADCNPLFLFDPPTRQIALVHVGWRGTAANLARKVVAAMKRNGTTDTSHLVAAIGPSIGPCCYRIHKPAQLTMSGWAPYLVTTPDGLTAIDLWGHVRDQLLSEGLQSRNIHLSQVCTACNVDRYFSYWKEKPKTGRFASILSLR